MKHVALYLLLALTLAACTDTDADRSAATETPAAQRLNILWINCEDISPMLPMFGDSTIETPSLSRLAARGIRYPNTFSVAGVCAPSRSCLVTGMYPISIGAHQMRTQWNKEILASVGLQAYGALPPPEVKMLPQMMREAGYFTSNNQKTDYQFESLKTAWDENGPMAHWRHRDRPEQPFFSVFDLEITHESQVWMTGKGQLRFQEGLEDPDRTTHRWGDVFTETERPPITVPADADIPVPPYLVDSEITRKDLRRVYSNIRIMDTQVGFLLDQLEADGLTDNTVIFFFSDHGGPLPRQKRLMYDSGLRVPFIVAWPGDLRAGAVDSALISFVDLPPTVLNVAGLDVPDWLQGRAVFGTNARAPRTYVFAAADRLDEHHDRIRAARDHRYKYLRNYHPERGYYLPLEYRERLPSMQELLKGRDAGTLTDAQAQWFRKSKPAEELFDTRADPHELNNIVGDPAYAVKLAELRGAMDDWLAEVGDLGAEPEIEMVQRFWNGGDRMPQTGMPLLRRDGIGRFVLESKTPGAQIAYRVTSPGAPAGPWRVYTGPLDHVRGDTLRVVAQRIGYRESEVGIGW